jgi:hypothetical protein
MLLIAHIALLLLLLAENQKVSLLASNVDSIFLLGLGEGEGPGDGEGPGFTL